MVDSDRDVMRDREDLPAPEEILARLLQRKDVDRLSAHQIIEDFVHESSSLARLGAILEDAARTTTGPLPWAEGPGARPPDPADESAWLTAATAVTAYRERYEVPDHAPMLGRRPAASRLDAQAAWDHASLQADRYLARRLRDLDDQQLAGLDAPWQRILDDPPPFDPSELERARRGLDAARGSHGGRIVATGDGRAGTTTPEQLIVRRLERAAEAHRR